MIKLCHFLVLDSTLFAYVLQVRRLPLRMNSRLQVSRPVLFLVDLTTTVLNYISPWQVRATHFVKYRSFYVML